MDMAHRGSSGDHRRRMSSQYGQTKYPNHFHYSPSRAMGGSISQTYIEPRRSQGSNGYYPGQSPLRQSPRRQSPSPSPPAHTRSTALLESRANYIEAMYLRDKLEAEIREREAHIKRLEEKER